MPSSRFVDFVSAMVFLYVLCNILNTVGPLALLQIVFQLSCLYIVGTTVICLFVLFSGYVCSAVLA